MLHLLGVQDNVWAYLHLLLKRITLTAAMCWTIKTITSHYSNKSCKNIGNIFQLMFPDSFIAKTFACAEKKTAHLVLHPMFSNLLTENDKKQNSYVLLFDESMNSELESS